MIFKSLYALYRANDDLGIDVWKWSSANYWKYSYGYDDMNETIMVFYDMVGRPLEVILKLLFDLVGCH